jgi:hypothetical protein
VANEHVVAPLGKRREVSVYKFRLSLCGKAEANRARVFCFSFSKKQAFLPMASPAATYLGSYKKRTKKLLLTGPRRWAGIRANVQSWATQVGNAWDLEL